MTEADSAPNVGKLVRLSGTITGLKQQRGQASFVLTAADSAGMGAVAIAAGLAGLSGQAIALASAATSAEEEADHVEFKLGTHQLHGWLWRSPFQSGDQVEVAACWDGQSYQIQAVSRCSDGIVALHPHCSRGSWAHGRNAVRWWLVGTTGVVLAGFAFNTLLENVSKSFGDSLSLMFSVAFFIASMVAWLLRGTYAVLIAVIPLVLLGLVQLWGHPNYLEEMSLWAAVYGGLCLFFGLMSLSLSSKWMPFVRVAESAFRTLGWPNPESIDLVRSSKNLRSGDEPAEYGTFYFRYKPD